MKSESQVTPFTAKCQKYEQSCDHPECRPENTVLDAVPVYTFPPQGVYKFGEELFVYCRKHFIARMTDRGVGTLEFEDGSVASIDPQTAIVTDIPALARTFSDKQGRYRIVGGIIVDAVPEPYAQAHVPSIQDLTEHAVAGLVMLTALFIVVGLIYVSGVTK